MPRTSRAQAELHHQQVIEAASKLVREKGADRVSVPEVMAAVGLTHGGFYRRFSSKDDLVAQACSAALAGRLADLDAVAASASAEGRSAWNAVLGHYLSTVHRDDPGLGCAIAALAGDVARAEPDGPLRHAYVEGLRQMAGKLADLDPREEGGSPAEGGGRRVLAELSTMVGALLLARACAGDDLSDEILAAAKEHLRAGA
ncbi:TetR/AcrR family transcriptional regulator [Nonomuraea pusilla]|uniref:Transcriptional regulator, TetR family n=1 Tax=Nonomuraea pusilla TaxID=46177 RepID=A0A1H8JBF7_9ACTN|nr:TetR/AcrR family transcriptional regulator [Nonomuraea pusilla]SEN77527.1 transcriptional regulator, TetR family [Nonomuraea pusilla]